MDVLENILAITVAIITMGGLGYFLGLTYQKRIQNLKDTTDKKEDNSVIRQRLMNVRNHTMRLKELYSLRKRVADFDRESEAIDKSIYRIEIILDQLHRIIEEGDELLAETILTRFSKHLRQLLHECASTEIEVSVNVEHVENIDFDTYTYKENFFSFRRSRQMGEKDYGRCISTISLIAT